MPLEITRYEVSHEPMVAAFNERGSCHGAPFMLSRTSSASWLPKVDGAAAYREYFLAVDQSEVRGGYTLRRQVFWLDGETVAAANYQGPLSEGLWDRRYMMAGVQMLRSALKDQPFLYALGMGGPDQPLPKLLRSSGWSIAAVPFYFRVLRPTKFLREIRPLRRSASRSFLMDIGAFSGAGALGIHTAQWWRGARQPARGLSVEQVARYGDWTDVVWAKAKPEYRFTAVRDAATQNVLFGDGNEKNITLRCRRGEGEIGWAVVRSTQMVEDKYFGNMRVGSLVDCLAVPGEEPAVVTLASQHLGGLGSDVVVTNQSHSAWRNALTRNGYFSGPSNFLFACSPALNPILGPIETALPGIHFNRADGDGPIHL